MSEVLRGLAAARQEICLQCPLRMTIGGYSSCGLPEIIRRDIIRTAGGEDMTPRTETLMGSGKPLFGCNKKSDGLWFRGTDNSCPLGKWLGLEPIDIEARRLKSEVTMKKQARKSVGAMLTLCLDEIEPKKQLGVIVQLIKKHHLPAWLAKEIAASRSESLSGRGSLERYLDSVAADAAKIDVPKPCKFAQFQSMTKCCGPSWVCKNPDCPKFGKIVTGKYCTTTCELQEAQNENQS